MAVKTISPDKLAEEISKLTGEYSEKLIEEVNKGLKEAAYHTRGTLQKGGPYKDHKRDYTPSWWVSTERASDPTSEAPTYIVHNRKRPQLAHLLEKGYLNRQGKRIYPRVHIAGAEEKAQEWAIENVEKAINKVNGSI